MTATEALGGMRGSSAEVRVTPWQEEMGVVVWLPSQGEFLDVMRCEARVDTQGQGEGPG